MPEKMARASISGLARNFLVCGVLAGAIVAGASAQTNGRLVQAPEYGSIQRATGETLLIAEPKAACPDEALVASGFCIDEALTAMRETGLTEAAILAVRGLALSGIEVRGDILDVRFVAEGIEITQRSESRLQTPRNCYAIPGEGPRYAVHQLAAYRIAVESQLVACDGAAPPQPWTAPPIQPLPVGVRPPSGSRYWPAAGSSVVNGQPMPFASTDAACPDGAKLKDGLCFAGAIAHLQMNPGMTEILTLGAKGAAVAGATVTKIDQYVVRFRRNRYDADKLWIDRPVLSIPDGCAASSTLGYRLSDDQGRLAATPFQQVSCGPPTAPPAEAIYEFLGDEILVVMPGSCGPTEQLAHGCGSHVMSYMRQTRNRTLQILSLRAAYQPGTVVAFRGAGSIRYDIIRVTANEDFSQFRTDTINRYTNGVQPGRGCSSPRTWIPGSEGVVLTSGRAGRFFEWQACPY